MTIDISQVFLSDYRQTWKIGKGNFGIVYKWERKSAASLEDEPHFVAVKTCIDSENESEILEEITPHPNIVQILGIEHIRG